MTTVATTFRTERRGVDANRMQPPVRERDRVAHERATVSVVIPAKNEALNLPWVLERLPADIHEVIVVDGISTDGTPLVARR